ncbi:hypothetical protein JAAARDRAFT_36049 [Jaapia argillacea MUCL 33604]|uniref:Uncharacterized protein n=1 Tax=Jaapia argillacea MUCL 33604 TaxID=933084 RepID=A0A067PZ78_9AGAM|nr:hypothetical protein JAAARDRAFT_36049 [Jaapia argillacea MUCL 33604]
MHESATCCSAPRDWDTDTKAETPTERSLRFAFGELAEQLITDPRTIHRRFSAASTGFEEVIVRDLMER